MIQVAHITGYNLTTGEEEIFYFTSSAHLALNNQNYIPRIEQKLSYTEHLFSQGTTSGAGTVGIGDLVVTNTDGALDNLVSNYAFDGRAIKIYVFDEQATPTTDNSTLYFSGIVANPKYGFDNITFVIKNRMEALNVALQSSTFAGTNKGTGAAGGLEGQDTTIGGKAKPMVFGRCMSVEGTPVNDFFLVYAFNFTSSGERKPLYKFYNLYVKGIQYLFCGDYATNAALIAAVIPSGYYATCLVEGLARLGSVPASNGSVVADVADAPEANCTAGQVAARVFAEAGYSIGDDYNGAALNVLDAKNACPVGILVDDTGMSVASVLNEILSSIGAWIIPDNLGVFQFDIVDIIDNMQAGPNGLNYAPVIAIPADIIDPSRSGRVDTDNQNDNIPAHALTLNHTKVWKTQDSSALANAVSNALRTFFKETYRSVQAENTDVLTAHLLSNALNYDTLLNQPLQASLQNGDFSSDLTGLDAGWTFGNLGTGNGAVTQVNSSVVLTPTNSGQCYIQQTLVSTRDIQPGDWQLMVTIPAGYSGQIIIAQGPIGLFNTTYLSAVNEQDLIIPFTMLGTGTQSITITLQTKDAVSIASFSAVVVCQPLLPVDPIFAPLINEDFNSALGTGWTFSNNPGGTGTGAVSGGVCTLTPSGTGTAQIAQTLTPPSIWPGNWMFGITMVAGTQASITIAQGAAILVNSKIIQGTNTPFYIPFPFTSLGTQALTITIATIDASTICKVSNSFVCLNHIDLGKNAFIRNAYFALPISQLDNGWTLSHTGSASYSQQQNLLILTGGTGVASITQTLSIPDDLQAGNQTFIISNDVSATSNVVLTIRQGNVQLVTTSITSNTSRKSIPFTISSFGANTLTITLATASSGSCVLSPVSILSSIQGLAPTYAPVVNGNFIQSVGVGWTFANSVGGTGKCTMNGTCRLSPVAAPCSVSQAILAANIPTGNWTLGITLMSGYAGAVTILSGTTVIFKKIYTADSNDQPLLIPFSSTGSDITIKLSTKTLNPALFSNCFVYSNDTSNTSVFANVINGGFANTIVNLEAGWVFSNAVGGTGTYTIADAQIVITAAGTGESSIAQPLNVPNAISAGDWTLNFSLLANTTASVSIVQNGITLAADLAIAVTDIDTAFAIPFTVPDGVTSPVVLTFATSGLNSFTLYDVDIELVTLGLTIQEEADRRLGIESQVQERYTLDIPLSLGFGIRPGQVVQVLLDRFGMKGKEYLVIGRDDDHDTETILLDVFRA